MDEVCHERKPAVYRTSSLRIHAGAKALALTPSSPSLQSNEAIDFLDSLLRYDHQERITAREALEEHSYFNPVREAEQRSTAAGPGKIDEVVATA